MRKSYLQEKREAKQTADFAAVMFRVFAAAVAVCFTGMGVCAAANSNNTGWWLLGLLFTAACMVAMAVMASGEM